MNKTKLLDGMIAFVVAVILILFLNGFIVGALGITGIAVSELLLLTVPIGFIIMRKESLSERFNLKLPTIGSFFSAVLFILGINMWESAATYLYVGVFGLPEQTDVAFLETVTASVSPMMALILVALIPAVCEELLFRGYLFNSFKIKENKVIAVISTSILFSLIHFDLYKALPILVMALGLGYITAKTDSVLIPAIFHFINNAMALISYYTLGTEDAAAQTEILPESGDFYLWVALGAVGMGLILVYFGSRLLSGKPRKRWMNVTAVLVAVFIFGSAVLGLASDMVSTPYSGSYSDTIRQDTVYNETFTLEEDAVGVVSVRIFGSQNIQGSVLISDSEKNVIYNSASSENGSEIDMKKGEYTVTYAFDVPEGDSVAYDIVASVDVTTVGTGIIGG